MAQINMTGERREFVGANISSEVKQALREEAKKAKMSVSKYVHTLLKKILIDDHEKAA